MFVVDDMALAAAMAEMTAASAGAAGAATAAAPTLTSLAPTVAGATEAGTAGASALAANAAPAALNPATTMAAGNAAPGGYASILQPLNAAPAGFGASPGQLGSGLSGAANPALPAGNMMAPVTPNGGLPLGMTSAPGTEFGLAPGAPMAPGSGMSGSGAFATSPGNGVPGVPAKGGASLKPEQVAQLNKLMNNQDQRTAAPPAAPAPPAAKGNISPASLSTPALSTNRASLAQILGIK